jgi:hypothetical protein
MKKYIISQHVPAPTRENKTAMQVKYLTASGVWAVSSQFAYTIKGNVTTQLIINLLGQQGISATATQIN